MRAFGKVKQTSKTSFRYRRRLRSRRDKSQEDGRDQNFAGAESVAKTGRAQEGVAELAPLFGSLRTKNEAANITVG